MIIAKGEAREHNATMHFYQEGKIIKQEDLGVHGAKLIKDLEAGIYTAVYTRGLKKSQSIKFDYDGKNLTTLIAKKNKEYKKFRSFFNKKRNFYIMEHQKEKLGKR
ncbi:MAG: hypothetical protein ACK5HR_05055 [Mycoplasmatales bacterium]